VIEYFGRVAEAISIPMVAQDHPASSGVHMSVPLIARLVDSVPRISCLKEEGLPTPARIVMLRRQLPCLVPILTGVGAPYGLFDLEQG